MAEQATDPNNPVQKAELDDLRDKFQALESRALALEGTLSRLPADQLWRSGNFKMPASPLFRKLRQRPPVVLPASRRRFLLSMGRWLPRVSSNSRIKVQRLMQISQLYVVRSCATSSPGQSMLPVITVSHRLNSSVESSLKPRRSLASSSKPVWEMLRSSGKPGRCLHKPGKRCSPSGSKSVRTVNSTTRSPT